MKPFLEVLTWVTFAVAMVVSPVAWFRMVRAKTRAAYWKNIVLFAAPIFLVFLFANGAGLMPEAPTPPPTPPNAQDVFMRMPTHQLVLLAAAAILWVGGGNVLLQMHNRRLGKKWWQALNPVDPPFKDFNTREWLVLGALLVGSMGLGALAISFGRAA
jgi:hypothetical protein